MPTVAITETEINPTYVEGHGGGRRVLTETERKPGYFGEGGGGWPTQYNTKVGSPTSWMWKKCGYGGAEKCPVGSEPNWTWQAPTSEGPNKTPQGGPLSFIWGSE